MPLVHEKLKWLKFHTEFDDKIRYINIYCHRIDLYQNKEIRFEKFNNKKT